MTKELEGKTLDTLDYYGNPLGEGNSPRSVVLRWKVNYRKVLKFECKELYRDIKCFLRDWDGIETHLLWFINLITLPLLLPVIPFVRSYFRYKEALKDFRKDYMKYLTKKTRSDNVQ